MSSVEPAQLGAGVSQSVGLAKVDVQQAGVVEDGRLNGAFNVLGENHVAVNGVVAQRHFGRQRVEASLGEGGEQGQQGAGAVQVGGDADQHFGAFARVQASDVRLVGVRLEQSCNDVVAGLAVQQGVVAGAKGGV